VTMRLMVTGGGGFVAGSVIGQAGPEWDVHAFDRIDAPIQREGLIWHALDLCDSARLREEFLAVKPTAVIHTAAMADIDFCQENQQIAERVNVGVTRDIARLCADTGTRMIMLSTDSVFDGERGLYTESDVPRPINFYAETKVRAEQIVAGTVPRSVVTRLSLVMGLPIINSGNSFLSRMVPAWKEGKTVGVPDNEIRTPLDVVTLGRCLLEISANGFTGFIHLAGNDRLSRYEMVCRIAKRMGFSEDQVAVKNAVDSPDRAPRPRDASLSNAKAKATLKTPMQDLDDAIELVLSMAKGV
jgi:dTDP-4-dehydrorhamnose reductase